jgi:type II restriction enzyme
LDISNYNVNSTCDYVKQAIAGIEIRSSAFLIDKYDDYMAEYIRENTIKAIELKDVILGEYRHLLDQGNKAKYIPVLNSITEESVDIITLRVPGWTATEELRELNDKLKELKKYLDNTKKRSFLSITPKVEDLKVVHRWINYFGVPHYYFQVFFDKIFAISFLDILSLLTRPDMEDELYYVEGDVRNMNKRTVKIRARSTSEIAHKVDEPDHSSVKKELARGQLLYYVVFEKGGAKLNIDSIKSLLGIAKW